MKSLLLILFVVAITLLIFITLANKLRNASEKELTYMRYAIRDRTTAEELKIVREKAHSGLQEFTSRLLHPQKGDSNFVIALTKIIDSEATNGYETFWVKDIKISEAKYEGVIIDDPFSKIIHKGEVIEFTASEISDWRYIHNGMLVGGEWLKDTLRRMTPRQRWRYLNLLNVKIEEFENIKDNPEINENVWRSMQWGYIISFPNNWNDPEFDNDNINTKSSLDVYCKSNYDASVAVFINESIQFGNEIDTMEEALKSIIQSNANERFNYQTDTWSFTAYKTARSFYYDVGNWRYHYSLIILDKIGITISFHVPKDQYTDSIDDINIIRNSITFQ